MLIALLSFRPIKNIMNLTISNQANTYLNLSTLSKLIVDVTYIYVWFKKMTFNKTNKKLKKYVYFVYFELQLICFIKPTPIHKHNLWNKFSPLRHYHFIFFWIIKIKEMILNIIHSEPKNFLLELSVKAIICALLYTVCIRWNTLWITSEDEILEQFNWSGWLFNFKSIMGIDSEPHGISTVLPPRCLSLTHR